MSSSYMLVYENGQNPYEMRRNAITEFIEKNTTVYVSDARLEEVSKQAHEIMKTGVKYKDACHVVCAIMSDCKYFLTTDRRLLKYQTDKLKMMNPLDFIRELEV
ncbi:MAG: type II toxin-antitoxin system VapC family toxin [Eubacteriales bacterium]|nr:type II toxin-antitoxin system VapC family toxin [Eubacteriales bacterium]